MTINSIIDLHSELIRAASSADQSKVLELIQSGVDINMQDLNGRTALIWSCMFENMNLYILNYINLVNLLIANGANINLQENNGKTALMYACTHSIESNDILSIVNFLLRANSHIDIRDHEGNTALMLAVKTGNLRTISMLLHFSPDPNLINHEGKSVIELAQEKANIEIYDAVNNYINRLALRGCFLYWRDQTIQLNYNDRIKKYINLPKEIAYNIIKFCP